MNTYLILINLTDKGIAQIKESPARLDQAMNLARKMGGEFNQFYLTMGDHDMAAVVTAPDDATVAKIALTVGAGGSVRTKTLKVFSETEYRDIINNLP
jgi:uncharacterized protein with GYD domain